MIDKFSNSSLVLIKRNVTLEWFLKIGSLNDNRTDIKLDFKDVLIRPKRLL